MGVHIGILDSTSKQPDSMDRDVTTRYQKRIADETQVRTTPHGDMVFPFCYYGSPLAEYSFYQAATEEGISQFDYVEAIEYAIAHEVDLLNVSYGEFLPNCSGGCFLCRATQKAIDSGISVVVAAGNSSEAKPSVFCPAILDGSICVGSLVSLCTNHTESLGGSAYQLPPSGGTGEPDDLVYCGQQGCEKDDPGVCVKHREERPWARTASPVGDKPDVLSPGHTVGLDNDNELVAEAGTSYSAPITTTAIANALSELTQEQRRTLNPYQIRNAVRNSAKEMDEYRAGKLHAWGLLREFQTQSG